MIHRHGQRVGGQPGPGIIIQVVPLVLPWVIGHPRIHGVGAELAPGFAGIVAAVPVRSLVVIPVAVSVIPLHRLDFLACRGPDHKIHALVDGDSVKAVALMLPERQGRRVLRLRHHRDPALKARRIVAAAVGARPHADNVPVPQLKAVQIFGA